MSQQQWAEKDFYKTLGVSSSATDTEIKKAYRKLTRELHPDYNKNNPDAEKRFKEVSEAYTVIGKPAERKKYDDFRKMVSGGPRFTGSASGGFSDVFGNSGFSGGSSFGGANLNDLFGGLFGQNDFGGFSGSRQTKGQDLHSKIKLSFLDAVKGVKKMSLNLGGNIITINIPAGISDGKQLKIKGKGAPSRYNGGVNGDLILNVSVEKHQYFSVDGYNIRLDCPVKYDEIVLGAQISVPTIDGDSVTIKISQFTSNGTVLKVKNRGVYKSNGTRGDMLVKLNIVTPNKLSKDAKQALANYRELTKNDKFSRF